MAMCVLLNVTLKAVAPARSSMMGNEEVQERTRTILYDVLDREIEKRIEKTIQGK